MRASHFIGACAALTLAACDSKKKSDSTGSNEEPIVVRREGQPDMVRTRDDDQEIEKAMQTAAQNLNQFVEAFKAPKADQTGFSIRKRFTEKGMVEHMWVIDLKYDGRNFSGRLNNEPVDVKNVKLGDIVTISPAEVSDWLYIQGGKLVGGYTVRVFHRRMSSEEKKNFAEQTGFQIE
jgi:uncharacterized protein YegJ (DUF2314 family)